MAARTARARSSIRLERRSEAIAAYALIAVPMILFLILNVGSIFYALFISLWKWNVRSGPVDFEGLDNYGALLSDPIFLRAIQNSVYYTLVWVPLTMVIGLSLAVIVNQKIRGRTFFRAAFYFPAITSSAAITILWIFIVSPDGLFNTVRGAMGLNPLFEAFGFGPNKNWIGDQDTALNAVIILNAWTTSGTFMLFYLASLQSISNQVYEAAAIDVVHHPFLAEQQAVPVPGIAFEFAGLPLAALLDVVEVLDANVASVGVIEIMTGQQRAADIGQVCFRHVLEGEEFHAASSTCLPSRSQMSS